MEIRFRTRKARFAALLSAIWILASLAIALNAGESCYHNRCSLSAAKFLIVFITLGLAPLLVVLGTIWVRAAPKLGTTKESIHERNQTGKVDNGPPCPGCGSTTTLRTSRTGQYAGTYFWGCTKYPDCVRIVPLSAEAAKKSAQQWGQTMGSALKQWLK